MPTITTNAPVAEREFAGFKVNVPQLFAEGHALTANEAVFLNAQLGSVIGNQFGGMIRRNTEAAKAKTPPETYTLTDAQAQFDAMFTDYKIGESNRGGDGVPTDPTAARAHSLAVKVIKGALKAKGYKLQSPKNAAGVSPEKVNELAKGYVEQHPEVTKLAKRQLADEASLNVDLGDAA